MATTEHPAAHTVHRGVQPLRAGQGTSFIWRKLHSLLGIIPIGAFLIEHLLSNFEALKGPAAYAAQVKFLNSLPLVRVLEWTFIFIPLPITASTASISGCVENPMSSTIPGRATGCTSRSAGPASSPCSTSSSMSCASASWA